MSREGLIHSNTVVYCPTMPTCNSGAREKYRSTYGSPCSAFPLLLILFPRHILQYTLAHAPEPTTLSSGKRKPDREEHWHIHDFNCICITIAFFASTQELSCSRKLRTTKKKRLALVPSTPSVDLQPSKEAGKEQEKSGDVTRGGDGRTEEEAQRKGEVATLFQQTDGWFLGGLLSSNS